MDTALKIVTHLPLRELWRDDGFSTTLRCGSLTEDDITGLLRAGPVEFVVVDVGFAPRWIPLRDCYQFWKTEGKPHVAADARAVLDKFPDSYCYFASQWDGGEPTAPIVVLEKHH